MIRYIIRIPGFRLIVSAPDVWNAIDQVRKAYPLHRGGSARQAA